MMNFIFQSTVKAQDNKKQINALLDSIKNCYTGLTDYNFNYGIQEPKQQKSKGDTTSFLMGQEKNCDAECLCHSFIMYKGSEKPSLELFPINKLNPAEFIIKGNILFLSKYDSTDSITMTHPDATKLLKIKMWMEQLTKYCSALSVKNK